jgi:hypothetical protein
VNLDQPIWHSRRWLAYSKVAGSVDRWRMWTLALLAILVVSNIALGLSGVRGTLIGATAAMSTVTMAVLTQGRFIANGVPLGAVVSALLGVAYIAVLPLAHLGGLVEIVLAVAIAVAFGIALFRYGV